MNFFRVFTLTHSLTTNGLVNTQLSVILMSPLHCGHCIVAIAILMSPLLSIELDAELTPLRSLSIQSVALQPTPANPRNQRNWELGTGKAPQLRRIVNTRKWERRSQPTDNWELEKRRSCGALSTPVSGKDIVILRTTGKAPQLRRIKEPSQVLVNLRG